jgi:hypothetical protein
MCLRCSPRSIALRRALLLLIGLGLITLSLVSPLDRNLPPLLFSRLHRYRHPEYPLLLAVSLALAFDNQGFIGQFELHIGRVDSGKFRADDLLVLGLRHLDTRRPCRRIRLALVRTRFSGRAIHLLADSSQQRKRACPEDIGRGQEHRARIAGAALRCLFLLAECHLRCCLVEVSCQERCVTLPQSPVLRHRRPRERPVYRGAGWSIAP